MTETTAPTRKSTMQLLAERIAGRPLEDVLRELYVEKRHSDQEIADVLGVSRSAVRTWRSQFGISPDDRAPAAISPAAAPAVAA